MPVKKTYKDDQRKVIYLSAKHAQLFDAYCYFLFEDNNKKSSQCGNVIIRDFFNRMTEQHKSEIISRYLNSKKQQQ